MKDQNSFVHIVLSWKKRLTGLNNYEFKLIGIFYTNGRDFKTLSMTILKYICEDISDI